MTLELSEIAGVVVDVVDLQAGSLDADWAGLGHCVLEAVLLPAIQLEALHIVVRGPGCRFRLHALPLSSLLAHRFVGELSNLLLEV